ncbi:MAG: hypothetical protein MJB14_21405 [Spirochaetes bacterium]|nr:hypothetical protein [Spirochaetota bacterium]
MNMNERSIINTLLDNRCIFCNSKDLLSQLPFICNDCIQIFEQKVREHLCQICGHPLNNGQCPSCTHLPEINFDSFHYIQIYNDFFKKVAYMWKKEQQHLINHLFVYLLINKHWLDKNRIITIVPDTKFQSFKKGRCSLGYTLKLLQKQGYHIKQQIYKRKWSILHHQKLKKQKNRIDEIEKIYYLPKENINKYSGKITLIDDVYTSGATANYGAKLLKLAGFQDVEVITFFRAIYDYSDKK